MEKLEWVVVIIAILFIIGIFVGIGFLDKHYETQQFELCETLKLETEFDLFYVSGYCYQRLPSGKILKLSDSTYKE